MPKHLVTHKELYSRIELSESDYEGMLKTWAPHLFPGYRWYSFKPTILSPEGSVHPDAALIAEDGSEWWVIEIELARHSTRGHIEPQLLRLRSGVYHPTSADYLSLRHPQDSGLIAKINYRAPGFLVIVDDFSTNLQRAASDADFEVLSVLPFLSNSPQKLYAGAVSGFSPAKGRRLASTGVLVVLVADPVVVRFVMLGHTQLPNLADHVLVGSRLVRVRVEKDQQTVVLSLGPNELFDLIGEQAHYVLRLEENGPATLTTVPTLGARNA